MRILLINTNRLKSPTAVMPIGLCSVASSLDEAGHETRILDLCFSEKPEEDLGKAIPGFMPDIIGIGIRNIDSASGYNPAFFIDEIRKEIIEPCKNLFNGPIVLGGPAAGINGPELLEYLDLPYAIAGDGETAMMELAGRLRNGASPSGIAGLIIREHGAVTEMNPPRFTDDPNKLPLARPYNHLDLSTYRTYRSPFQVQTKRGCALKCTYCTYNRLEGVVYRLRDPRLIADEIEDWVQQTGMRAVEFVDSAFNIPLNHAKEILRELAGRNLGLRLSTLGLNPGFVDDELAELMKKAGFNEACLGAEAGSDAMLASLGKNFTGRELRTAAQALHKHHIPVIWFLLLGAPGETVDTLYETFRIIDRNAAFWDLVNIGVGVRVYCGSPIAKLMMNENPQATTDNFMHPIAYVPAGLDLETLKIHARMATALRHNYFMFDEGAKIPIEFRVFFNRHFSDHPIWHAYLFFRFLEKISGWWLVRALKIKLKNPGIRFRPNRRVKH